MKRKIFVCAACITMAGIYVNAQTKNSVAPPPPPPMALLAPTAPPPPPLPVPPVPTINEGDIALALPPAPPAPPVPPIPIVYENQGLEIINENGNEISVRHKKGKDIVFVKKDGKTQKIKLSTWNANRKYYQKKYGQLPPPPPEINFSAPVIVNDRQ